MDKPKIAVVGCGRVGTALLRQLDQAGYPIGACICKDEESALKAAKIVKCDTYGPFSPEMTRNADIVFITTPDGLIGSVCQNIADKSGFDEKTAVLHCSGALPSTILASARDRSGAAIGSMHPLQSFAGGYGYANPFSGIIMAVEGDDRALSAARGVATDLGAKPMTVQTEGKVLYHAAAVVASNYLVTLLDMAFKLLEESGIHKENAYAVLGPLIAGTLANVENAGIPQALTGPIARGDARTVINHLSQMDARKPELARLYRVLGRATVKIARNGGFLDEKGVAEMDRVFEAQ